MWEEEYDTRDAPNRWVRRKMEQENAKTTEQLRKKRSQAVQGLFLFEVSFKVNFSSRCDNCYWSKVRNYVLHLLNVISIPEPNSKFFQVL